MPVAAKVHVLAWPAVLAAAAVAWAGGGAPGALALAGTAAAAGYACAARGRRQAAESLRAERVGGCALGHREAVHLVRVADRILVLGVTPSSVTLLATERAEPGPGRPDGPPAAAPLPPRLRDAGRAPRPGGAARLASSAVVVAALVMGAGAAQRAQPPPESTRQIAGRDAPAPAPTAPAPAPGGERPGSARPAPLELPAPPGGGTLVWLALFALLPFALMAVTSFVKVSVVLSLLRSAIGTPQAPSDPVLAGIAMALTLFVMAPVTREVTARLAGAGGDLSSVAGALAAAESAAVPVREFLRRNARPEEVALFVELSAGGGNAADASSFPVLVPAFVTTELREAFVVGFLLFLPFLVVDLVVANILMSMGMVMVSPASVALPFKVLLFVLADGWPLLMKGLALSYR